MALLTRYDTPAFLPDFNVIPGQLEAWHRAVSAWFDQVIADDVAAFGNLPLQYYNAEVISNAASKCSQVNLYLSKPVQFMQDLCGLL